MALFGKKQPKKPQYVAGDLQSEAGRFAVIFNNIEDGVVLIDQVGNIQLMNPAAGQLTGWSPDDAGGVHFSQVIKLVTERGEAYDESDHPFTKSLHADKAIRDNVAELVSRSKKQFPIALSVTPLQNAEHETYAAVGVFRDVTQERQEEKRRNEFISTASHEMRTPVAAIEGYLSLAMNDKVSTIDARARGYLEKAHASTKHLGQLFQDLLNSAKAEDGRLESHPNIIEMGEFLEQLAGDLRFVAEKKGLGTDFTVGSGSSSAIDATEGGQKVIKPLYYVHADPDRLREVVTNIFDNAVKYTESGRVSLGLTGNEQVVQFYIKDTGHGIPPDDIPHLFQKFYRVDNSATRTIGGTGLGLYICRKIIELYHGRVWVESAVGQGSTFYINLPRLSTAEAQRQQGDA